eukprot:s2529_g12.t1
MNACSVDLREREDRSDRVEDLSQPSSSRSSDSNYLDQESKGRRPIRPPRPALLGRAPEEPRHTESLRADIAEEHVSISLRGNSATGSKAPKAPLQPEVWGKRQADSRAKGVVGALGNVVQEQLQMKYGLAIEVDDFTRKVESLCRAQSLGGLNEALNPCDVVSCLNNLKEMRFRTRDGKRSLALQLEPHVLETFEDLLREVSVMMGTACAIASVYRLHSWRAVAVFRQDYAQPDALVGRCSVFTEPLISFTAQEFRSAVMLGITVTEAGFPAAHARWSGHKYGNDEAYYCEICNPSQGLAWSNARTLGIGVVERTNARRNLQPFTGIGVVECTNARRNLQPFTGIRVVERTNARRRTTWVKPRRVDKESGLRHEVSGPTTIRAASRLPPFAGQVS